MSQGIFHPAGATITAAIERLEENYAELFGQKDDGPIAILGAVARNALFAIADTNCAYHDLGHTIMVTEVGQEILRCRQLAGARVTADDWLHMVCAMLCHDVGYVRGICRGDRDNTYVTGTGGETVTLLPTATDAALTPWHVDRGKIFVHERLAAYSPLDVDRITAAIERTRFPVPPGSSHAPTDDLPGMVRAADLIGQLADLDYLHKIEGLFREFEETGTNRAKGNRSVSELRQAYPAFFWNTALPLIQPALDLLPATREGRQWIANLYANVFAIEHDMPGLGPAH